MKIRMATSFLALCCVAGCSAGGREKIDISGGHPAYGTAEKMTPAAVQADMDTGRLLVTTGGTPPVYPGYKVYDPSGLKVAHQASQAGSGAEGAAELTLAPGRYFVRLDEPAQGPREFWVTVERAKVTRVGAQTPSAAPPTVR
jgi:hypothetical protein